MKEDEEVLRKTKYLILKKLRKNEIQIWNLEEGNWILLPNFGTRSAVLRRKRVDYIDSKVQMVFILSTLKNERQTWPWQNLNWECKNGLYYTLSSSLTCVHILLLLKSTSVFESHIRKSVIANYLHLWPTSTLLCRWCSVSGSLLWLDSFSLTSQWHPAHSCFGKPLFWQSSNSQ